MKTIYNDGEFEIVTDGTFYIVHDLYANIGGSPGKAVVTDRRYRDGNLPSLEYAMEVVHEKRRELDLE